jgi:hypothetical protein
MRKQFRGVITPSSEKRLGSDMSPGFHVTLLIFSLDKILNPVGPEFRWYLTNKSS